VPPLSCASLPAHLYLFCVAPATPAAIIAAALNCFLIVVLAALMVLHADPSISDTAAKEIDKWMLALNAFFTIDLACRVIAAFAPFKRYFTPKMRLSFSLAIVADAAAIAAMFVSKALPNDDSLRWLDVMQTLRLIRLFRLLCHVPTINLLLQCLLDSVDEVASSLAFLGAAVFFFGALIYHVERVAESDTSTITGREGTEAFPDMATAIWFMIVTFSTVGYGDTSPNTGAGKAVAACAILFGVTYFAIPIAAVSGNYDRLQKDFEVTRLVLRIQESMIKAGNTAEDVIQVFSERDLDGSGTLDAVEFKAIIQEYCKAALEPADARLLFRTFDWNGDGSVSYVEFANVVFPLVDIESYTQRDVQRLLEKKDKASFKRPSSTLARVVPEESLGLTTQPLQRANPTPVPVAARLPAESEASSSPAEGPPAPSSGDVVRAIDKIAERLSALEAKMEARMSGMQAQLQELQEKHLGDL